MASPHTRQPAPPLYHALAARFATPWQAGGGEGRPIVIPRPRKQSRLGKMPVVVRLLFRAHAVSLAFVRVVEARFLRDPATGLDDADVALDLVLQRLLDEAERVDVLDLGFGAEFLLSARPHADVGIAAQRTFFHVAVADAGVED